uniref:Fungal lipase-like domain-containing protein n=1 Tax=Panagrolaimus davidi TaxID=227884 RepID=A0A914PS13_9BILA
MFSFYYLLLLITTIFIPSTFSRAPPKFTDWFARHKFFPISLLSGGGTAMNHTMGYCFDNAELLKHLKLPCDIVSNNPNITAASTIVVSHTDEAIIITFMSTSNQQKLVEEMATIYETSPFPGGGTVSKFFYNAIMVLWNGGIKDAYLKAKNKNPNYEVWVTGGSMGGALSSLMAGYLVQMGYASSSAVKLMTFGEPRNEHNDLADRFPSLVPWAYRVVHRFDDIPHIVPTNMGYQHHKNEIWYHNDMDVNDDFIECDEPESLKCSNSLSPDKWSRADHSTYFKNGHPCKKTPGPQNNK